MFQVSATRDHLSSVSCAHVGDINEVCSKMMVYLNVHAGCTVVIQSANVCATVHRVAERRFASRWSAHGRPLGAETIVYSETQILEWCANVFAAFATPADPQLRSSSAEGAAARQTSSMLAPPSASDVGWPSGVV